jgi:hypothetical protein
MYFIFSVSCESNQDTANDGKIDSFLYFFIIVLVSLQKLIGKLFFVGFPYTYRFKEVELRIIR